MESDNGKLFIGGISWETTEDRLREYFGQFGDVVEAVIMRDRNTGRARGFGFIVFTEPSVAERVTMEKHMIDGRMVEAKKAVPRDDQSILSKSNSSSMGSPGPGRTRKIFVGGLASNVTDADFRKYFEQFGTIMDVVVMYDHNTQRPRGFGFITYDSEDAVDKVLQRTFHELNGKMVEVKRAVPKEQFPGSNMRSPAAGHNHSMSRINSCLNGYSQKYNPQPVGSYGMGVDPRLGLFSGARNGLSSFGPSYGMGMNVNPGFNPNHVGSLNISNSVNYTRSASSGYNSSSNRFDSSIGFNGLTDDSMTVFSSVARDVWGNGSLNYSNNSGISNSFAVPGTATLSGIAPNNVDWGSAFPAHGMGNRTNFDFGSFGRGNGENSIGFVSNSLGRNNGFGNSGNAFPAPSNGYEGNNMDSYSGSLYDDSPWRFSTSELGMPSSYDYVFDNVDADTKVKISASLVGNYTVNNKHTSRGIAS